MARKISVEIVGDSTSLERSFRRSSQSAQQFDKSLAHAARGAIAGSGAFEHLGRTLAFASGGFVAFAGVTRFLTDSIDAARNAAAGQRQLAAQMKASGQSFKASREEIEKAGLAVGKFGFTTEDSAAALTVLERATGNISRAINLQGTVANLARAKNISLAAAANVVAKVFGGQTTALRRAVPGLSKTAQGMDLIRDAARKLSGQAAAGTTAVDRFHATLHDTQVIIGTALLPVLNSLLDRVGKWLQRMNESGQLQRDVNSVVKTGTAVLQGMKTAVTPLIAAFKALGSAVGGTKNEVELLVAAFAAFKISNALRGLNLIGSSAKTAAIEVGVLRTALTRLAGIGLITVAIEVIVHRKQLEHLLTDLAKFSNTVAGVQGAGPVMGGGVIGSKDPLDTRPDTSGRVPSVHFNIPGGPDIIGTVAANARRLALPHVSGAGRVNPALTAQQKLQVALAQSPNDVGLLRQQMAFDAKQIAFLKKLHDENRISNKDFVKQTTAFWNDYNATLDTINSLAKKATDAASKRMRQNIPAHVSGEAFGITSASFFGHVTVPGRVGGAGPFGRQNFDTPLRIQVAAAKAAALNDLTGIRNAAQRAKDAALKAIHSGKLSLEAIKEAWDIVGQANSTLGTTITNAAHAVSSRMLTAGLNLSRDTRKALEARLALSGAFSGHVPTSMGVLGQSVSIGNLILPNVTDTHSFADELGKLGKTKPVQTVGHNAGRSRALP